MAIKKKVNSTFNPNAPPTEGFNAETTTAALNKAILETKEGTGEGQVLEAAKENAKNQDIPTTQNSVKFDKPLAGGSDIVTLNIGGKEFKMTRKEYQSRQFSGSGQLAGNEGAVRNAEAAFTAQNNPLSKTFNPQKDMAPTAEQEAAIANIGQITAEQQAAADAQNELIKGGALGDVAVNIASKAGAGAAIGATGGLATAGTLSAPLAIGGAVAGTIYGAATIVSELKEDAIQNTKVQKTEFNSANKNIKAIIDGANQGDIKPLEAVELFNRELAKIERTEANLKQLDESSWSKAKDELVAIQQWNDYGEQAARTELAKALLNPDNTKQYVSFQMEEDAPTA